MSKKFCGNENSGRRAVKSMFFEYADPNKPAPIYSLQEWHDTFLELRDPTEIKAALALIGSWKDWMLLKRDWPTFANMVEDWQDELSDLLRADAFQKILELQNNKAASTAMAAAKYIANNEFHKKAVGRPNKEKEQRATEREVRRKLETEEDWERIKDMSTPITAMKEH